MPSERFSLALDQLSAADWRVFELLASEFLAVEYPSLRTMAAAAGDKGRDAELFYPHEDGSSVAVQYSVSEDWTSKIRKTIRRLEETLPQAKTVIFVTNQTIGPKADDLKKEVRTQKAISLDVRDKSWFLERELTSPQRQTAAAELAERFVDPLLRARGVTETVATVIDHVDSQIALLHLTLDVEDKASAKGLTKSCFESLALSALEGTDADRTISLDEICSRVRAMLPSGDVRQINGLTISAVARIASKGGPVHLHRSSDTYCLSNARIVQTRERIAQYVTGERGLEGHLASMVAHLIGTEVGDPITETIARQCRLGIERILLNKGEAFAHAVSTGQMQQVDAEEAGGIIGPLLPQECLLSIDQAVGIIFDVMQRPTQETQRHLRKLADAYTLFAFLRQAPDVQKTMVKIFTGGQLWLDATVILPMLAETLIPESSERHFTVLLRAARDAGLDLFVTEGILEEVERHINRCNAFSRDTMKKWHGRVPFLYAVYALSGRARNSFSNWAAEFRGDARPLDDVADTVRDLFGVKIRNLLEYSDNAPIELRAAVQEVWQESHDRRRNTSLEEMDSATRARLVAHDVENCVGIIQNRRGKSDSPVGYQSWFLTMDRTAFRLATELPRRLARAAPASPIMSPDFLSEYLRLGASRTSVELGLRLNLPILTDIGRLGNVPMALIQKAEQVRQTYADLPERVIRRNVRDALDKERSRKGSIAAGGLQAVQDGFAAQLRT